MSKVRFVGLDVHKESIAIAFADEGGADPEYVGEIPHDLNRLSRQLKKLGKGRTLKVCYEAGPTGFALHRYLNDKGITCIVVAPSLVPQMSGDRVKTDRRDAVKLSRFYRSGDLTSIYVPDDETEAIRDLERAREDAKKAERVARQQLLKFLLRQGRRYPGKTHWTKQHLDWVRSQSFEQQAHNRVLVDYLDTVERATERVASLTQELAAMVETWSRAPLVAALQAMRGIQLVTAVTIVAELGDLRRFGTASELMSFLGLVPSEHSSGDRTSRGSITRAGNTHVRRALVESAWSYRFRPALRGDLRRRNEGLPQKVRDTARKAQKRLYGRYCKLKRRGMAHQKVTVAVARELAGFVWAIGQHASAQA